MGEQGYRSRNNVSRQFTEAEEAVSERTTAHLMEESDTMPAAKLAIGVDAETAYTWLERDLKRRDANTARLAAESQLAESQSLRQQLHTEAIEGADRKAQAADAVSNIAGWQENKFGSMDEAKQALLKERPDLAMNPEFNAAYGNLSKDFKTPQQRELEEITEQTSLLTGKLALGEAELTTKYYRDNPGSFEKMNKAINDVRVFGTMNQADAARLQADVNAEGFRRARENEIHFGQKADGDPNVEIKQKGAFKAAGMDVKLPGKLQGTFRQGSLALLMGTDAAYMARLPAEARADLEKQYNIITNPESSENERLMAADAVNAAAGDYDVATSELRKKEEHSKKLYAQLPKSVEAVNDGVDANLSMIQWYAKDGKDAEVGIGFDAIQANARKSIQGMKAELGDSRIPLADLDTALVNIEAWRSANPVTEKTPKAKLAGVRAFSSFVNSELRNVLDGALVAEREVPKTLEPKKEGESTSKLKPFDEAAKQLAIKANKSITDTTARKAAYTKWAADNGYDNPFPSK